MRPKPPLVQLQPIKVRILPQLPQLLITILSPIQLALKVTELLDLRNLFDPLPLEVALMVVLGLGATHHVVDWVAGEELTEGEVVGGVGVWAGSEGTVELGLFGRGEGAAEGDLFDPFATLLEWGEGGR
jgi:hypothetical protein